MKITWCIIAAVLLCAFIFLAVGIKAKIPPTRCRELYEQVRENI